LLRAHPIRPGGHTEGVLKTAVEQRNRIRSLTAAGRQPREFPSEAGHALFYRYALIGVINPHSVATFVHRPPASACTCVGPPCAGDRHQQSSGMIRGVGPVPMIRDDHRKPLAHYRAIRARSLAACSAELHHQPGHDPSLRHEPHLVETRVVARRLHGTIRDRSSADCAHTSSTNAVLKNYPALDSRHSVLRKAGWRSVAAPTGSSAARALLTMPVYYGRLSGGALEC
jgi:hypothetical protein